MRTTHNGAIMARRDTNAYSDPGTGTNTNTNTDYDYTNDFYTDTDNWDRPARYESEKTKYIIGAILIGVGIMILGGKFLPGLFRADYMLPLLLIVIGGIILYRGKK